MGNRNSEDEKTKPTFQLTKKNETQQFNVLPMKMSFVKTVIDPCNHKNYYIFGSAYNNQCWYFNHKTRSLNKIKDIPKNKRVFMHNCAMIETINDGNTNKYALIYGGDDETATYNIYEFETQKWNKIAMQLNNQWLRSKDITFAEKSKYGFGPGLSMITYLFEKNKIHIIGGLESQQKYGYFEFNQQILNNPNLSFVLFFCLLGKKNKTCFLCEIAQ